MLSNISKNCIFTFKAKKESFKDSNGNAAGILFLNMPRATNKSKMVICMLDGRALHGGLSDRLMGIISTYKVCKLLNLDFRIHFVKPFFLNDYLVPNKIDWKISYEEISYN